MSDLKIYLVAVNASTAPGGFVESTMLGFHQYLLDSTDIAAYWNYIPLIYMVKSHLVANQLTQRFVPFLGSRFIISEIVPSNVDGQLPKEAWEWIYFPHIRKQDIVAGIANRLYGR